MPYAYLAIDVGLTRLTAGVVTHAGDVLVRDRVATPPRNVWPAVTQLVRRVLAAAQPEHLPAVVGVTCPGPLDTEHGTMFPVGLPAWHDFPLASELEGVTQLPVAMATVGRGLALAELAWGATAELPTERQHFAAINLSDEVDGAIMVGGRLADGITGNAGQFGHLMVEPTGVACVCGAVGCLTMYAGARHIVGRTGRELQRTPEALIETTGIMVARAAASISAMLDVSEIVVGGVVCSVFGGPMFAALDRELDQRSQLGHLDTLRVRAVSGQLSPLHGAAAVARSSGLEGEPPPSPPAVPIVKFGDALAGRINEEPRVRVINRSTPVDDAMSGADKTTPSLAVDQSSTPADDGRPNR